MAKTSIILLTFEVSMNLLMTSAFAQTRAITFSVNDFRPLAAAARDIEQISGTPVNYEDLRCDFPGDQKDITAGNVTPAQERLNGPVKVIVPRGGPLVTTITVAGSTSRLPDAGVTYEALTNIVSAYNSSSTLPGRFRLESANGEFFLEPIAMRDASGNTGPVTPVLSTAITLPLQQRNAAETLDLILAQVSKASGFKIGVGSVPMNALAMGQVTIGADQQPASQVLAQLLNALLGYGPVLPAWSSGLSYRVLYDVQLKYYMFNVVEVGPVGVRYARPQSAPSPAGPGRPGLNAKP